MAVLPDAADHSVAGLEDERSFAVELAAQAGRILRKNSGRPQQIHQKGLSDVVTDADDRSEAPIIARFRHARPR